jgi:uncharacterized protein (TIGR02246 family)
MRTKSLLAAAVVVVLSATGCYPAAGPLSDEDVAAITALGQAYRDAVLAGDAPAIAALHTEDAVEMPPNMVARQGRAAIQEAYGTGPLMTTFTITSKQTEGFGNLAYELGIWTASMEIEGMEEPYQDAGKYMVVCEKQADGTWLMKATMWNSDIPMPE